MVEIKLPGVEREDIDIELAGRRLSVSGARKQRTRVGILRRRERVVGRFRHAVMLPGDVDKDGVEANLDEGVLTVRVPSPRANGAVASRSGDALEMTLVSRPGRAWQDGGRG